MKNYLLFFIRDQTQLSLKEIASSLDMDEETYLGYENGKMMLSAKQADSLGRLFGVDAEQIFESSKEVYISNMEIGMFRQIIINVRSCDLFITQLLGGTQNQAGASN